MTLHPKSATCPEVVCLVYVLPNELPRALRLTPKNSPWCCVARTEANELANPLRSFWNIISRLKAVIRSKHMYPNETVVPTKEDWQWVSSPSCPWVPRVIRWYLSLGMAVHCRFPTEML